MAIFTLTEIEEQITAYKAALKAVSLGKEYTVEGKSLTRADLPEIRTTLEWLDSQRQGVSSGSGGSRMVINRGYVGRGR